MDYDAVQTDSDEKERRDEHDKIHPQQRSPSGAGALGVPSVPQARAAGLVLVESGNTRLGRLTHNTRMPRPR